MFALFAPGSGVIRVGDTTEHGGTVLSGQDNYSSYGKAVAVVGDAPNTAHSGLWKACRRAPSTVRPWRFMGA